ncbi:hypothetical protein AB6735_25025 [Mucilaginibacter sp. RCC_168]|uniref:hypothetical protein n=1 Tax=Mucilaginibacter sp. RCC_168 TaxID=3239221 RepID=UPI0035255EEF
MKTRLVYRFMLMVYIICGMAMSCSGPEPNSALRRLTAMNAHERDSLRKMVLASYKDTIKTDTTDLKNGDTIIVRLKYYCTHDGKINVPQKYLNVYGLSKFQTHNFISEVEYKINAKILFKGIVTKEDFKNSLSNELERCGVLSQPNIAVIEKRLLIGYDITVPLTDYHTGYLMTVDSTGKVYRGKLAL